jgi:hypothetical protein
MKTVAELVPELVESLQEALRREGYPVQAESLPVREIDRWTYDEDMGTSISRMPHHQGAQRAHS